VRPSRLGLLALIAVALTGRAGAQEARVDSTAHFGLVGIVANAEVARVNAALATPTDLQSTCPIVVTFIDDQGNIIGDPTQRLLQGFGIQFVDFTGDRSIQPGTRVPLRATVAIGDPGLDPACAGGVLLTMEIFDQVSRLTRLVLPPNPVVPPSLITPAS